MLNVVVYAECFELALFAECHYTECHYFECHYAECHYAECRYFVGHYTECHYYECHYAECHGPLIGLHVVSSTKRRSVKCLSTKRRRSLSLRFGLNHRKKLFFFLSKQLTMIRYFFPSQTNPLKLFWL
jgi:hypothetical protein